MVIPVVSAAAISAQSQAPRFEVAAIRPAMQDTNHSSKGNKGAWQAHNLSLKWLAARVYDIDISLISGGPKWVGTDGYDINAKIPEEFEQRKSDVLRLMM